MTAKQKLPQDRRIKQTNRLLKGLMFSYRAFDPRNEPTVEKLLRFKFTHRNPVIRNYIEIMVPKLKVHISDLEHDWVMHIIMQNKNVDGDDTIRAGEVSMRGKLEELDQHVKGQIEEMRLEAVIANETLQYFDISGEIKHV